MIPRPNAATPPKWKVVAEGCGHYSIYKVGQRGSWSWMSYALTIEQARQWLDVNGNEVDNILWEV